MPAQQRTLEVEFPEVTAHRALNKPNETSLIALECGKGYNGGITVHARVTALDGQFRTFSSGDFRKQYFIKDAKRVTQKAVDTVFAEVVTDELMETAKREAIEYYIAERKRICQRDGIEYVPVNA